LNVDASYFKLDLPLPICFQRMLDNIDVILSDFEELEVKHYGRSSAPVDPFLIARSFVVCGVRRPQPEKHMEIDELAGSPLDDVGLG
jgi:hypothetical protein